MSVTDTRSPRISHRMRLAILALVGGAVTLVAGGVAAAFAAASFFAALEGNDWVGLFVRGVVGPIAGAALTWYFLRIWVAKARPTYSKAALMEPLE